MRIDKRSFGAENFNVIAHQLVARHVHLMADHVVGAEHQVLHGDVLLDGVRRTVQATQPVARQVQGCFTQRLAGDGARVDAHAADHGFALDQCDALVQLGGLNGGALAGRA